MAAGIGPDFTVHFASMHHGFSDQRHDWFFFFGRGGPFIAAPRVFGTTGISLWTWAIYSPDYGYLATSQPYSSQNWYYLLRILLAITLNVAAVPNTGWQAGFRLANPYASEPRPRSRPDLSAGSRVELQNKEIAVGFLLSSGRGSLSLQKAPTKNRHPLGILFAVMELL